MKKPELNWTLWPYPLIGLAAEWLWLSRSHTTGLARALGGVGIWAGSTLGGIVLYVLFVTVVSLFIDTSEPPDRYEPFHHAMVTYVEGLLTALAGVRIHTTGLEKLPEGRFLLVGNHRSGFDPLVTGWVLRHRRLAFILKPSIRRLIVVGPFVHRSCFLAIDRENDREALKTILHAAKLLKEDVVSYGIYPEGTRSSGDEMLPFRNGAFKIAQKAKKPVVAVAIRGTEQIRKRFPWRVTHVYLEVCAVLDAERVAQSSTADTSETVRAALTEALARGGSV